jgi:myo-inositol-1(or 4)-monophosphatase
MTTTPEPAALLDLAVSTAREAADLVARGRASAAEQVDV